MKKIILAITAMVVTSVAMAQQITIDPEVGVNFGNIKTEIGDNSSESDEAKAGLRIGVGMNIGLGYGLYVKPGLYYVNKGSQTSSSLGDYKTHLHYLELPINLGYRYQINGGKAGGIFAEAGPYVAYALSGKVKGEDIPVLGTVETDINFGSDDDETKAFDWGFNFAGGYETPWGVYLKAQYGLGLGNLSNVEDVKSNNKGWFLSLGYRIGL